MSSIRTKPKPLLGAAAGPSRPASRPLPAAAAGPIVTFSRFREAPKVYEASADGIVIEAGVAYEFDVFEDGDVRLWLDDRRIRAAHKLTLRAAVLAAYRATSAGVLAALSAAIDTLEAAA